MKSSILNRPQQEHSPVAVAGTSSATNRRWTARLWLKSLAASLVVGGMLGFAGPASAADPGDPRQYNRDVEHQLRNLERREFNRTRDAERRYNTGHVSPREHYEIQRRLHRQRSNDVQNYERWQQNRDRNFDRAQQRAYDRNWDRHRHGPQYVPPTPPRIYEPIPHSTGYRGFEISTPGFTFQIR